MNISKEMNSTKKNVEEPLQGFFMLFYDKINMSTTAAIELKIRNEAGNRILYSLEFPQLTRCVLPIITSVFSHENSCKNLHNKTKLQKCKNTNAHGMMLQKCIVKLQEHKPG